MTAAKFILISTFTSSFVIDFSSSKLGARSKSLFTWRLIYRGVATTFGMPHVLRKHLKVRQYVRCGRQLVVNWSCTPHIAIQPSSQLDRGACETPHTVADMFLDCVQIHTLRVSVMFI